MNRRGHLARAGMAIMLGLLAALNPARAQEPANSPRPGFTEAYPANRLSLLQRATDLMGAEVRDRGNHKLGKITDLVVDCSSWRVICALVRPANFYGTADYFIAVPAKSFLFTDTNRAVVDMNMTNLLGEPPFKSDGWDAAEIYKSLTNAYGRFHQPLSWDERTGLGRLARCSDLLDMDADDGVVNIGKAADWMIDLPAERVMFALIAFYGWDGNLHAVPPGALALDTNKMDFQLKIGPSQTGELVNREEFLRLNLDDPAWAAAVYRDYGQKLVFEATTADSVARTRQLVRDYVPPPPKVVTNPEPVVNPDAETTRKIWTAILTAGPDTGFLAKDVKISTVNGKVTLTGHVATEKERGNFEKIAQSVAGTDNVTNALEVKQ